VLWPAGHCLAVTSPRLHPHRIPRHDHGIGEPAAALAAPKRKSFNGRSPRPAAMMARKLAGAWRKQGSAYEVASLVPERGGVRVSQGAQVGAHEP
jgi:hypothetical protein